MNTQDEFDTIARSELCRTDGPPIDLPAAIIRLCEAITEEENTNWELGEYGEFTLADFIIGAHWALSEWHGGQASDTYAALSATGNIYTPNMANGPEPESGEAIAYEMICQHFQEQADNHATT